MSALFETHDPIADAYIDAALQTAGIGVLAFMLSQYEEQEEYEECAIICKAIAAMLADPSFQFIGMEMGDNQFRRSTNRMKHWAKYRQFIEAAATKDHNQQPTLF